MTLPENDVESRVRCLATDCYTLAIAIRRYGVSRPCAFMLWNGVHLILEALLMGERNDN